MSQLSMRSLRGVPEDEKASKSILTAVKFDETSIQNESDFSHLFTKKKSHIRTRSRHLNTISDAKTQIKTEFPSWDSEHLTGKTFVQFEKAVGNCSIHFETLSSHVNYMSSGFKLDSGNPIPNRVFFHEPHYTRETKTFTCETNFDFTHSTFQKCRRHVYEMVFNDDFTKIMRGQMTGYDKEDNKVFTTPFAQDMSSANRKYVVVDAYIRVVSAVGLKSVDFGGKSDPYCVVTFKSWETDQSNPNYKKKIKTKKLKKELNPVWEESFNLTIPADHTGTGTDEIQFHVRDWNRFSKSIPIGHAKLPVWKVLCKPHSIWTLDLVVDKRIHGRITTEIYFSPTYVKKIMDTDPSWGHTFVQDAYAREWEQLETKLAICPTLVSVCDQGKNTALHWTAARGHLKTLKQLIMAGSDLNAVDCKGMTPITMAVVPFE